MHADPLPHFLLPPILTARPHEMPRDGGGRDGSSRSRSRSPSRSPLYKREASRSLSPHYKREEASRSPARRRREGKEEKGHRDRSRSPRRSRRHEKPRSRSPRPRRSSQTHIPFIGMRAMLHIDFARFVPQYDCTLSPISCCTMNGTSPKLVLRPTKLQTE